MSVNDRILSLVGTENRNERRFLGFLVCEFVSKQIIDVRYLSVADKLAYLFKLNALCVYTTCVYFLYEYLLRVSLH